MTNSNQHPIWVPSSIKEYLRFQKKLVDRHPDSDILKVRVMVLEKLSSRPEMEKIWKRIDKNTDYLKNEKAHSLFDRFHDFFSEVHVAFTGLEDPWERLTPLERIEQHKKIIKDLKITSRILAKFDIDFRFPFDLSDEEFKSLLNRLDAKFRFDFPSSKVLELKNSLSFMPELPDMSKILLRIAETLESNPPYSHCITKQPNSATASRFYFMKRMLNYNREVLGSPFYEQISDLAKIFFDTVLSTEQVRSILK